MSDRRYLYVGVGSCTKGLRVNSRASIMSVRSEAEAIGEALLRINRDYPEHEGWGNHGVEVMPIPDETLAEAGYVYQPRSAEDRLTKIWEGQS